MYSQSYPIQRVEGSDTLVVMTKAQAQAMNQKFITLKHQLDEARLDYGSMKAIADSLATQSIRNAESLRRAQETLPKAVKELNAEWWSRMAFVTWGFLVYTLSNG
jgi:hypothetical protein